MCSVCVRECMLKSDTADETSSHLYPPYPWPESAVASAGDSVIDLNKAAVLD